VAGAAGRASVTTSGRFFFRHEVTIGTAASTGAPARCSAASLEDTASSRLSRRNAAARPRISPAARPSRPSVTGFGELGEVAGSAGLTRASALVAAAPLTWIWESWTRSTASWLTSEFSSEADLADLRSFAICRAVTRIWLRSCVSALVAFFSAALCWVVTNARA
jgi:hypothetical protein